MSFLLVIITLVTIWLKPKRLMANSKNVDLLFNFKKYFP